LKQRKHQKKEASKEGIIKKEVKIETPQTVTPNKNRNKGSVQTKEALERRKHTNKSSIPTKEALLQRKELYKGRI